MPMPSFQLSVELTNIAGALITSSAYKDVIDFGRILRKSGSEIVVEEDLAIVFGRAKIDHVLESQFKEKMKGAKIVPLHSTCSTISLQSGPGPTVTRAMRDQNRRYMSAVIQLSFLGILLERNELASSIAECMNRRIDQGVEDNSGPTFEDIHGTLEACSSQTSNFNWQPMIHNVESTIRNYFSYHDRSDNGRQLLKLQSHMLLASMDYFYLIQSLPEDRIMLCRSEIGVIPLVLWAHHILGLTVEIRSQSSKSLFFGKGQSGRVIILWRPGATPLLNSGDLTILLLDKSMKIVLSTTPDNTGNSKIITQERHTLQSFGSTILHRLFNEALPAPHDDSPLYIEMIELVLAMALYSSRKIERTGRMAHLDPTDSQEEDLFGFRLYSIEPWRVLQAANIIFHQHMSKLDDKEVKRSWQKVQRQFEIFQRSKFRDIKGIKLPVSVQLHVDKLPKNGQKLSFRYIIDIVLELTSMVFIFSHVKDLEDCRTLPLCLVNRIMTTRSGVSERLRFSFGKPGVDEETIFVSILRLLVGSSLHDGDDKNMFLVSDFGWSVYLDSIGDRDPCEVNAHLIHIKPGVPINNRGERKSRIRDAETLGGWLPGAKIMDEGQPTYRPRCVCRIAERAEYYVSRSKEFWLSLGYRILNDCEPSCESMSVFTSYRELHESLWTIDMIQTEACQHSSKSLATARLGLDTATFIGSGWTDIMKDMPDSYRIIICLTKDDARARWLAVKCFGGEPRSRKVLLRSRECCEDCALDAIAVLPGRWIIII